MKANEQVENDELWSMKLLKTSLKALKVLLSPLQVFDSFLMRRRVRPDGTKGIAPAEILFVVFIAGIVFSFVYGAIFRDLVKASLEALVLGCVVSVYYVAFYQIKTEEFPLKFITPYAMAKIFFYYSIFMYAVAFYALNFSF